MVHDMGQSEVDDSTLQIPDGMPGISEVYAQYTGDDEPAEDHASGVELDEDHFDNFEYEMEPHSDSDFDHEFILQHLRLPIAKLESRYSRHAQDATTR